MKMSFSHLWPGKSAAKNKNEKSPSIAAEAKSNFHIAPETWSRGRQIHAE
jgi:hypothetical protein